MRTYAVRVSRRDGGWDAGIEEVGSIRVPRLTGVEAAVRAHLALLAFGDAATAQIRLDLGPQLEREVRAVRDARQTAEAASRIAAERSRELAARLVGQGLLGAEVALVLGVSPQRASQLLAAPPDPGSSVAASAERTTSSKGAKKGAKRTKGAKSAVPTKSKSKKRAVKDKPAKAKKRAVKDKPAKSD